MDTWYTHIHKHTPFTIRIIGTDDDDVGTRGLMTQRVLPSKFGSTIVDIRLCQDFFYSLLYLLFSNKKNSRTTVQWDSLDLATINIIVGFWKIFQENIQVFHRYLVENYWEMFPLETKGTISNKYYLARYDSFGTIFLKFFLRILFLVFIEQIMKLNVE